MFERLTIARPVAAAALLMAALLLAAGGAMACTIEGEVVAAGQGVDGVAVRSRQGVNLTDLATTDRDGRFTAPVAPLQGSAVLILIYEKAGFASFTNSLNGDPATRCPVMPRQVVLEASSGGAGAADGSISRTLYVSPYALFGNVDDADRDLLNGIVDQVIGHRIRAYSTSLQLASPPPEVSVRRLDEALSMVDRERIRSVGSQHHALAVITGEGELRRGDDGVPVFDLFSDFTVMARYRGYSEHRVQVGDTLPREAARPSRLSEHLDEFWGRKAMIALAVRELAVLPSPPPRPALLSIQDLLIKVRGTMRGDDPLLAEVQELIRFIDAELGP